MKILDCSLRDGGHLNNWSFDDKFAQDLYNCAKNSNIDYLEVGYRNSMYVNTNGAYAYSRDEFLSDIFANKSPKCKITVMAQHGKFSLNDFIKKEGSIVDVVRVATYPDTIQNAFDECVQIKDKGYEVFLNLMAISRYKNDTFEILESLNNKDILDYLVISDSFGALFPNQVKIIVDKLLQCGFDKIGFHAHNNLQLAFANSLTAIESGCDLIDATINGLGRGAGNLPIELLLGYLSKNDNKYNIKYYLELINQYFTQKHDSILTMIGGLSGIHQNYLDDLQYKFGTDIHQIFLNAENIAENASIHYDKSLFN